MTTALDSAVARDVAYALHPNTNLRRHQTEGERKLGAPRNAVILAPD